MSSLVNKLNEVIIQIATDIKSIREIFNTPTRNNGLSYISTQLANEITIPSGAEFNLFNSINGLLSLNNTTTFGGDTWDKYKVIDNDYLGVDPLNHTTTPRVNMQIDIFINIPLNVSGGGIREFDVEIRRRTNESPSIPLAITGRKSTLMTGNKANFGTLERIPTRTLASDDPYFDFGFALFLINNTGNDVTLRSDDLIRIELLNHYQQPVLFTTLVSPN